MMAGEEPISSGMSSTEDDVQFWEDDEPVKLVTTIEVEDSDGDDDVDNSESTCLRPSEEEEEEGWGRGMRERWVDKSREMTSECRLLVRTSHGPDSGCICMDMTEVQACRDLGLELPCDWTVEIPSTAVSSSSSAAVDGSPIANWTISSPGDDPDKVKARLKVWAQAVALASATHLATG